MLPHNNIALNKNEIIENVTNGDLSDTELLIKTQKMVEDAVKKVNKMSNTQDKLDLLSTFTRIQNEVTAALESKGIALYEEPINLFDAQYHDLIQTTLDEGFWHDATGMYYMDGTMPRVVKIPQVVLEYDLRKEFPISSTKKMFPLTSIKELIWIQILGSNYIPTLQEMGVKVWDQWMKEDGTIGKAYGWQARHVERHIFDANGNFVKTVQIDQVQRLVDDLIKNPYSRRHMINLWNVADLPDMSLVPCVFLSMWDVTDGYLNLTLTQRSADGGLGYVFNATQYSSYVYMIAQVVGLKPGKVKHVINNFHIYDRHIEALEEQLTRKPFAPAKLIVDPSVKNINDFRPNHFKIEGYQHHPAIPMEIAIHTHPDNLVMNKK